MNLLENNMMVQNLQEQSSKKIALQKKASQLKKAKEDKELKEACKDFEAILLNYMLKSMRNTVEKSDILNGGLKQEIFESMYDQEIATHIAHSNKNTGLGDMLYKQLNKNGEKNGK